MMQNHPFECRLAQSWDPANWSELTVLVAVSGGADSVALLRGLQAVGRQPAAGRLAVAHVNHHLRGAESDADEQFVRRLCRQLDVPCEVVHAELSRDRGGEGLEAIAREERYRLLTAAAARRGARFLATAHTADDQAETILHRVLRGTSLRGLAGIPFTRRLTEFTTVVRPLLPVTRQEVLDYLHDCGQAFRQDSSNQLTTFTRNRLRHQLMPQLAREYNPQVVAALLRLGDLAREAHHVIDALLEPLWEHAVTLHNVHDVEVARDVLREQPPFLVRALLVRLWEHQRWPRQQMSAAKWSQLCDLIQKDDVEPASFTLPGNVHAAAGDATVRLRRRGS